MPHALPLFALLTTALVAFSGCSDGGGSDDDTETPTGSSTPTGSTSGTTTAPPTTMPPAAAAPIYINGTVQGAYDCTNPGAPPLGVNTQPVPMEAWNRTYSLTLISATAQAPTAGRLCLVWDTGDMGNSGTVPSGAASVSVAADFTYEASYSIKVE